ncbi:hypothetical protein PPROV_000068200 [Pycnococcus provasolii]|uniref:Uncharacterized protein n=1 Tax=Pycnococcus provasolii TaxID=41880 RepID=A0A830H4G5_9CHLO|nr:hypothetical protein PPROV_000068200 [Pycnococcus provasolii]
MMKISSTLMTITKIQRSQNKPQRTKAKGREQHHHEEQHHHDPTSRESRGPGHSDTRTHGLHPDARRDTVLSSARAHHAGNRAQGSVPACPRSPREHRIPTRCSSSPPLRGASSHATNDA